MVLISLARQTIYEMTHSTQQSGRCDPLVLVDSISKEGAPNIQYLTNMSTNVIASDHRSANPNADLMNVNNVNGSLLNPKSNRNIGTWNVQTMYSTSKTAQIVKKIGNYQLDILGISECRWTGSSKMNSKNDKGESYTIIHSGQKDTHHRGVALIMNRESANTLMEWEPIMRD